VTKLGAAAVTNGQSFTLFSAPSSSGDFAAISPIGPASGLAWSFNPTNGVLKAIPGGVIQPTPTNLTFVKVAGNQLVLGWPDGLGWILQAQTNGLARGISTNWADVVPQPTPPYTNTLGGTNGTVFFRLYSP
jgi:hypothetical protein